jgi:hypothetical protein
MRSRKALAALMLIAVACGKRGDPHPPVPVIPQATGDLVVTQRADQVILSWSYPSLTTAGRSLPEIRRISVFRYVEELPAAGVGRDPNAILPGDIDPALPQPIALFGKIPTVPQAQFAKLSTRIESIEKANLAAATAGSRLVYTDKPPFTAPGGRPVRITYSVVTEGATARGDFSNLAIIVPLPVATPPAGLKAAPDAQGVVLSWDVPKTSVSGGEAPVIEGYQIFRTDAGEELNEFSTPLNTAPVKSATYTDVPPYGEHEYRVAAIATTGPPVIQSGVSAPVKVTFKDLAPPPVPASLDTLIETNAVRLIWSAVEAPDLAGYRLYRTEGMGQEAQIKEIGTIPLGPIVTETNFVDARIDRGIAYKYSVTAVDKSGNESARVTSGWVVVPKSP